MILPDEKVLIDSCNKKHKEDIIAIKKFCKFMLEFEKCGEINGNKYELHGISIYDRVASFKNLSGGRDYFFDGYKK